MKKILVLLLMSIISLYAIEPNNTGELSIELINRGTTWNVTFMATALPGVWDENLYLSSDYNNASVTITNDPFKKYAYFGFVYDDNGDDLILAIGKYKISAIENNVEQAFFYMDLTTSDTHTAVQTFNLCTM